MGYHRYHLVVTLGMALAGCKAEHSLDETTRTRIDAAGGMAHSADGLLLLSFPAGAVAEPVEITVQPESDRPASARRSRKLSSGLPSWLTPARGSANWHS